jgi:hypothetical protein
MVTPVLSAAMGLSMKVKLAPVGLVWPLTETVTETAPEPVAGAVTVNEVALAAVTLAVADPNWAMLLPGVVLKPVPVIVTTWLGGPLVGESEVTEGVTAIVAEAAPGDEGKPAGVKPSKLKPADPAPDA